MKAMWACAAVALLAAGAARAAEPATLWSFTEENDGIFSRQDRHYTQGLRIARSATPEPGGFWSAPLGALDTVATKLGAATSAVSRYQWPIVGQSLFTPSDIGRPVPDPTDRPYAGWLYVGAGLVRRDAGGRTDRLQILLGVVGPPSLARETQNAFHSVAGFGKARGYDFQLHTEPGLLVQYQTIWDFPIYRWGYLESDVLPEAGLTAGNVLTYGQAGGWLRVGHGLAAGGTPETITPGLSGTGGLDVGRLPGRFGWMVYGGIQTRAVWRNLFLEGNSYRDSPGVEKRNFVTDEMVGTSLLFRFGLRLDITYIKRSREFSGQRNNDRKGLDDRFGSVTISWPL